MPAPKPDPYAPFEMAEIRKFALEQAARLLGVNAVKPIPVLTAIQAADLLTKWITTGAMT